MRFRAALLTVCALLFLTSIRAAAQSTPGTEKQIAQVMNTWVEDWNERRIDDLTKLYYSHAVLLPADGSRAEGQSEIRASLQKQIEIITTCNDLDRKRTGEKNTNEVVCRTSAVYSGAGAK